MKNIIKPVLLGALVSASSAIAAPIVVTQFEAPTTSTTVDTWYSADVRPGGTATIQNLTGAGGNLENNQPLPSGAARLTTDSTTAAKAEVSTYANYGLASSVLSSINLGYSYYKTPNTEQFAAPSLKLTIYNPNGGSGDNYGQLVYEPNWNQAANGSSVVPSGDWQTVSIDENTGNGSDAGGGWWWSGGFGLGNGNGGPPLQSLAEWLAAFQGVQGSANTDFADAEVIGLSVGVGTYNINQDDYFDGVSIQTGNIDKTYDFQAGSVPDGGSTLAMLVLSLAGIAGTRIRSQFAKK